MISSASFIIGRSLLGSRPKSMKSVAARRGDAKISRPRVRCRGRPCARPPRTGGVRRLMTRYRGGCARCAAPRRRSSGRARALSPSRAVVLADQHLVEAEALRVLDELQVALEGERGFSPAGERAS